MKIKKLSIDNFSFEEALDLAAMRNFRAGASCATGTTTCSTQGGTDSDTDGGGDTDTPAQELEPSNPDIRYA